MYLPSLKFVALSVPEIIGGTQVIWAVPGYAHAHFSPKFFIGLRLAPKAVALLSQALAFVVFTLRYMSLRKAKCIYSEPFGTQPNNVS